MKLFDYMGQHNHEEVVSWTDKACGLKPSLPFTAPRWGRRWVALECSPIILKTVTIEDKHCRPENAPSDPT